MTKAILAEDLDNILDHTRGFWDQMRGERIFITGGTGFFGHWLLESFLWANQALGLNARAVVLTRHPQNFIDRSPHLALADSITLLQGDVRNFDFPAGAFSFLMHAATSADANENLNAPLEMLDTIVGGTRRVLDFASGCGAYKFLLTSSGAVYGTQPAELTHIPESFLGAPDPLNQISTYGEGKRLAEHLCEIYSKKISSQIKIARCFAFVGPHLPLDRHFAIGNFIRDGLRGGPIIVRGDGTPHRSYLYSADLAIWLWTILFQGKSLKPYNVGSDESHSIKEIASQVAGQFSWPISIDVQKKPVRGAMVDRYVPEISRITNELGVSITVSLQESIKKTIAYNFNGL